MAPILLRFTLLDSFVADAVPDPPHAQGAQSGSPNGSKRTAVVRTDGIGQSVLTKGALKHAPYFISIRCQHRHATNDETAGGVGDCQRIDLQTIARVEPAFEVCAP